MTTPEFLVATQENAGPVVDHVLNSLAAELRPEWGTVECCRWFVRVGLLSDDVSLIGSIYASICGARDGLRELCSGRRGRRKVIRIFEQETYEGA
jgi:hypothetical protein